MLNRVSESSNSSRGASVLAGLRLRWESEVDLLKIPRATMRTPAPGGTDADLLKVPATRGKKSGFVEGSPVGVE